MTRRPLTDQLLKSLPPAPKGTRIEIWDRRIAAFGIRVSAQENLARTRHSKSPRIAFVLFARFGSGAAPTRRVIGIYPETTLAAARQTAKEWEGQIRRHRPRTSTED
jgi:Arm DNA-binding domain